MKHVRDARERARVSFLEALHPLRLGPHSHSHSQCVPLAAGGRLLCGAWPPFAKLSFGERMRSVAERQRACRVVLVRLNGPE